MDDSTDKNLSRIGRKLAALNVPPMILDKNWHNLFQIIKKTNRIARLEKDLNTLLKKRAQITENTKGLKRTKKDLVKDIMDLTEKVFGDNDTTAKSNMDKSQAMILEINDKMEKMELSLANIEDSLTYKNALLLEECVKLCYQKMNRYQQKSIEIGEQIAKIELLLKQKIKNKEQYDQQYRIIMQYAQEVLGDDIMRIMDEENGRHWEES